MKNKKDKKTRQAISWKSPYVITIAIFAIWMGFFDKHSILNQMKVNKTITAIETEIGEYEGLFAEAQIEKKEFEENKEKFAREEYNFSKDGEQIFIIK